MCSLSDFPIAGEISHFNPSSTVFSVIMWPPFLQVISPGLEKQSIQSRLCETGGGKKEIWEEISPEVVGRCQKKRRSNLEGRRIFPSQVIHLCLQKPELLCLCCTLESLAARSVKRSNESTLEKATKATDGWRKKEKVNGTTDKVEQIKSLTCGGD